MADDAMVMLLARLDEPVVARPAFAEALREALHVELGFATATAAVLPTPAAGRIGASRPRTWLVTLQSLVASLRPMTPRLAVLILLALLLVACTVAGAWIVVHDWLSSGARGIQYTNDFALAEVYRLPGEELIDLQAGPDGRTLYAVRQPLPGAAWTSRTLERLDVGTDGTVSASHVIALEALRQASLWPPAADIASGTIVVGPRSFADRGPLSVAPDGEIFLSIGIQVDPERAPTVTTTVVVHADGTVGRVVSLPELAAEGLLDHPADDGWVNVTASAPGRLWARAEASVVDAPAGSYAWLLEITDPNLDGDWSDRVVKHLVLPNTIPHSRYGEYDWLYAGFVAEPSTPGHDRSASVLLPVLHKADGEYRIYRVADPNNDGDATDPGETELLFTGTIADSSGPMDAPTVVSRVADAASPPIDELVVAGLSRMTRLSRITDTGVVDIARAITSVFGVATIPDGSIYLASWEAGQGAQRMPGSIALYRLTPVPVGAPSPTDATPSASAGPTVVPTAGPMALERHPLTDGVQRIGVWYGGTTSSGVDTSELVLFGADGSGAFDLVPPNPSLTSLCPSADGIRVAYWSDEDVPNESYVYVSTVGGTDRQLVEERANMIACPFPREAIVTLTTGSEPWQLTWHPIQREAQLLVKDVAINGLLAVTPDGKQIALATGAGGTALTRVDAVRGEARTIGDRFDARIRCATWSAGADRLAVVTGPWDPMNPEALGTFDVWLVDVGTGARSHLTAVDGRAPCVGWSPDGRSLSILTRDGALEWATPGKLVVVDTLTGERRLVISDAIFAAWSPVEPHTLAYASRRTLTIERDGIVTGEFPGPTGKLCPVCTDSKDPRWPAFSLGWSPDGRYIGTGDAVTGVIDVATGDYKVIVTDGDNAIVDQAFWWP